MSEGFGRALKPMSNIVKPEGEEPLFQAEPYHTRAARDATAG